MIEITVGLDSEMMRELQENVERRFKAGKSKESILGWFIDDIQRMMRRKAEVAVKMQLEKEAAVVAQVCATMLDVAKCSV